MAMFPKIGAAIEVCEIEVTIHSVKFSAATPSGFEVVVKRGKGQKEQTSIRRSDTDIIFFDTTFHFRATMYKRNQKYLPKIVAFRLVQHTESKTIKNGKAKIDISGALNSSRNIERADLPLKKATDKRASICISVAFESRAHSSSITSDSTNLSNDKNVSLRIREPEDYEISSKPIGSTAVRHRSPEKTIHQEEKKEMFHKRLMRLQTLNEKRINLLSETDSPLRPPPTPIYEREVEYESQGGTDKDESEENIIEEGEEDSLVVSEGEDKKVETETERNEIADHTKALETIKHHDPHEHTQEKPVVLDYEGQFVVKPIEIPCGYHEHFSSHSDDEEPESVSPELLIDSPKKTEHQFPITAGLVGLPPTSLQQIAPNANSKKEAIKEKELIAGIKPTRKGGACTGCLIF